MFQTAPVTVERAEAFSQEDMQAYVDLHYVLSPESVVDFDSIASQVAIRLQTPEFNAIFAARFAGRLVGRASAYLLPKDAGSEVRVEELVAFPETAGQKVGERLTVACVDWAKELGAVQVELTTAPHRIAANHIYEKLGFEIRETNVRRLQL